MPLPRRAQPARGPLPGAGGASAASRHPRLPPPPGGMSPPGVESRQAGPFLGPGLRCARTNEPAGRFPPAKYSHQGKSVLQRGQTDWSRSVQENESVPGDVPSLSLSPDPAGDMGTTAPSSPEGSGRRRPAASRDPPRPPAAPRPAGQTAFSARPGPGRPARFRTWPAAAAGRGLPSLPRYCGLPDSRGNRSSARHFQVALPPPGAHG